MASVRKEIVVAASCDDVWAAVRDWGALHERLAPGFVLATELDGPDRIVTFASGAVLREVLVDCDDERRRLAWTIVDGPYRHHNGSIELESVDAATTRFVWRSDVLPDAAAAPTAAAMDEGLASVKRTLERPAA